MRLTVSKTEAGRNAFDHLDARNGESFHSKGREPRAVNRDK
jgi:hypothetical protein